MMPTARTNLSFRLVVNGATIVVDGSSPATCRGIAGGGAIYAMSREAIMRNCKSIMELTLQTRLDQTLLHRKPIKIGEYTMLDRPDS